MHPHTGTHKHKLSYRNALLSLWFSCKPNKSYPLRSACFCSWLPRVRLSWKKGISIHSLPGCVLWGIKHTFRYYVIHWEVWIWGQYQMSGNLKERRKTMTGKIHMQRVYFEALQLIKRWGSTDLVTVQKSNGWIVWFWKVINTKILFPSTVSVKPEKVTLKRQWVWDNHWKHLPPCQHSFHSSDAWGCQHGHVSQQSWTSSLFSVVFFCLFFFFFPQVNLDISHADGSNKNLAWATFCSPDIKSTGLHDHRVGLQKLLAPQVNVLEKGCSPDS